MPMQRTLLLLKPDAVARRLTGKIITRLEEKGLLIVGMKLMTVNRKLAAAHYAEHKGKHFYDGLISFITSGPVVALAVEGIDAISVCRKLTGKTNGREAEPGSIRGDFGMSGRFNLIHASDSAASARRELLLYFSRNEYVKHTPDSFRDIYDFSEGEPV